MFICLYSASTYKGIASLAKHLLKDINAVRNAIMFDYSNGIAEGFNNKIKAIKREMYGRAGKDLLEKKHKASARAQV
ncbi:MAG: transposase [Bacteroidales bacterium]|nr:transposase [Candidatus Cacconaster scatequi]